MRKCILICGENSKRVSRALPKTILNTDEVKGAAAEFPLAKVEICTVKQRNMAYLRAESFWQPRVLALRAAAYASLLTIT